MLVQSKKPRWLVLVLDEFVSIFVSILFLHRGETRDAEVWKMLAVICRPIIGSLGVGHDDLDSDAIFRTPEIPEVNAKRCLEEAAGMSRMWDKRVASALRADGRRDIREETGVENLFHVRKAVSEVLFM